MEILLAMRDPLKPHSTSDPPQCLVVLVNRTILCKSSCFIGLFNSPN